MAKQPISNYIYYTLAEALDASVKLGCSGYRTYLVDGVRVYLPCDELATFEKLTSYTIVKGLIVANGNETFGGNLVGMQLTTNDTAKGDAFFTMGNFSINTTVVLGQKEQPFVNPDPSTKANTATSLTKLTGDAAITKLGQITDDKTVKFNFSKTNFNRYTLFGSLSDKIKFSLIDIGEKYPAAIKFRVGGITYPTIAKHAINQVNRTTTIELNTSVIFNPFDIIYSFDGLNTDDTTLINPLRNLTKYYSKYDLVYKDVRYDLLSFASVSKTRGNISVTISDFPFISDISTNGTLNAEIYIVPKKEEFLRAMDAMSDMAKYLLNKKDITINEYTADFTVPIMDDNGNTIYNVRTLKFPTYDNYNIDIFSNNFDNYLGKLNDIANDFDAVKTNLVSRFLTTDSLKEFDTDDRKADIILKSYGKTFDTAKQYIDALAFMTRISYDKVENVPDLLLKNFARTIGWKTYEIEDENTIVESLFDLSEDPQTDNDITPAELDIELWRRLLMNTAYLFKSKGTRKSVDAILRLVGVPELIYEINEYIYIAQNKLDYGYYQNKLISLSAYPVDGDGYPTVPTKPYFQKGGGNVISDSSNSGPYDFGEAYLAPYKKFDSLYAFDLYKTIDNKKSWVITTSTETRIDANTLNDTNYEIKDSRLIVNVKNLDVFISLDRIIDSRIYKLFKNNNVILDSSFDASFTNGVDPTNLSFNGFIRESLNNFINVKNRKTIVTYPTLTKIYYDYIQKAKDLGLNAIDYDISLNFLQKYDSYWVDLIRQFIPATSLLNAGKKIANSKFNDNKFKYFHGQAVKPITGEIDSDINWLGTDGSEFQQYTLKPVIDGRLEMVKNLGTIGENIIGTTESFDFVGDLSGKISGKLNRSAYFKGNYYGLFESCKINPEDITDQSYWDDSINFICPPPMPHVCYYSNSKIALPTTVFTQGNNNNSNISSFTSENTQIDVFLINEKNHLYVTPNQTSEITATFTTDKVLTTTNGASLSLFVELEYENMLLHTFSDNNNLVDSVLNPTLEITFLNSSNTTISETISIELKPTLYNSILDSNKIRFNTFITNPISGDIKLKGVLKLNKIKSTDGVTRDTSWYDEIFANEDFDTIIANGVGIIKILGFKVHSVPQYSDIISTSANFLDDWFSQKYFIQQPRYYALKKLTEEDASLAITDNNNKSLLTKDGWFGEYKANTDELYLLSQRDIIDPLMHVPTIYEKEFLVTDKTDTLTVNLSKSLQLSHVFSPTYINNDVDYGGIYNVNNEQYLAKKSNNQEIDGKIYISDSVSIFFDGMYATTGTIASGGPGPLYKVKLKPDITSHISGDILCAKGIDTYIKLAKPSSTFENMSDLISINGSTTSYYQVNSKQLYKFKGELIFDSEYFGKQGLVIKLVDDALNVLAEQSGVIASSKNSNYASIESRTISFDFNVFLDKTTRVYLVVKSSDADCYLKEYEEMAIEPQKAYDTNAFINIIPAKWHGNDKLYYEEETSIGLPGMILSYGANGYNTGSIGDVSKANYLTDMKAFANQFRYAKDFYYDKIVFETNDEFVYKNITIVDGVTTINPDTVLKTKTQTFEYLPFYLGEVAPVSGNLNESIVGLINHSSMFDVSKYANFGSINLGKKSTSAITYNISTQSTLAENERRNKVRGVLGGTTIKTSIDPLDYAYSLTGPFGLDGMKNASHIYPFSIIDKDGFISGTTVSYEKWPYYTITTNEYNGNAIVSGLTLTTTAIVATESNLTSIAAYDGAIFIVTTDTTATNKSTFRQLSATSATDYTTLSKWEPVTVSGVKEYIFTPVQSNKPLIGDDSYLNILNISLKTASNAPLYLSNDTAHKLKSAFLSSSLTADGSSTSGYLPRGLSNTSVKYQKKSHVWAFGTVIQQFNNEMNLYSTGYREKSNGSIAQKDNTRSMGNTKIKNIDNNGLFDYAFAKSGLLKAPVQYGTTEFYNYGTDLIMSYKIDRDQSDFPITGEFIGRLTIKDICGNVSTTIMRFFIANDIISLTAGISTPTETVESLPSNGSTTVTVSSDIETPAVLSRTLNVTVNSVNAGYSLIVNVTGSISGTLLSGKVSATSPRRINFKDNESLTISYEVFYDYTTVTSITLNGIQGTTWHPTGGSGETTIPASKLIQDISINFTIGKINAKLLESTPIA